ncbi:hypothetical protein D3C71_1173550 [compost metagenome]
MSVQMTLVDPSASTAGSLRIIACCLAILFVPTDKTIVTIEDRASGIAATATATANIRAFRMASVVSTVSFDSQTRPAWMAKIKTDSTIIATPSCLLKVSSLRCSGVCLASALSMSSAILPISVVSAVPVTTRVPRPYTTKEPLNAILRRSPSGDSFAMVSVCFSTASDSPVSMPSLIFKLPDSMIRPSAGTKSPASSNTISPRTSSLAGTVFKAPSRNTLASGADICCRASSELSALRVWMTLITALRINTRKMISDSIT